MCNEIAIEFVSTIAWGNFRNPYTRTGANTTRPMFDRGFTGHEHLYDFGLINMNGRMYDPVMSSFLSVDNYVQSPENSQNFNRYAYCLNNPLKYTDPDGEFWHLVIGAAIGGTINLLTNLNNIDNFGQGLAYFGIGALAGAMSAGVAGGISSALWEDHLVLAFGDLLLQKRHYPVSRQVQLSERVLGLQVVSSQQQEILG